MALPYPTPSQPVHLAVTRPACPLDRVNRRFKVLRPNALWVSDFTYVATWSGFDGVDAPDGISVPEWGC